MTTRQPHPAVRRTTRPLREDAARAKATAPRQHARGERILRDGTVSRRTPAPTRRPPRRRRGVLRIPLGSSPRRLHAMLIVVAMALSLCAGRLLQLQGFDSSAYAAGDAFTRTLPLLPARGEITDRNGLVLASTQPAVAVTADPSLTGPKAAEIAIVLSGYLGMPVAELMPILTKPNTRFIYVKKKVPALVYSALSADLAKRDIYGIFREADPVRSYPNTTTAASVVGFVGADGKGQGGLEWSFNRELSGVEGTETYESAPNGSKIPLGQSSLTPAQNGLNLQTTIDSELQWVSDRLLSRAVRSTGRRLGHRDHHRPDQRRGAGPEQLPDLRLQRSVRGGEGGPGQPGDHRLLRTGQRAEGADLGRADRLRAWPPRRPSWRCPTGCRRGAAGRSRTSRTTRRCTGTCAGWSRTPPTSVPPC